jgi:arylsulfatase A-like enzyme
MSQTQGWMEPFLLDAVRDFDDFLRAVVGLVVEAGRFYDTLVVFSSDHGLDWNTTERVPLIIRLPPGAKGGRFRKSVELIDVAPTILDYIGAPIPAWMEGRSLLDMEAYEEHPIVAFDAAGRHGKAYDLVNSFFGSVSVVACGRWYGWKVRPHDLHVPWSESGATLRDDPPNLRIHTGAIPGYTGDCDDRLAPEEFDRIVRDHFAERGYGIR